MEFIRRRLALFAVLATLFCIHSTPTFTPLQAEISARTHDLEYYVSVTDETGRKQRIVVDYFQPDVSNQAQEFCLGTKRRQHSAELTTSQQQCLQQLTPLLESRRRELVADVEQKATDGVISVLKVQLTPTLTPPSPLPSPSATPTQQLLPTVHIPLWHGGLRNVSNKVDEVCDTHDIGFDQCDRMRSVFIQEYIEKERRGLSSAFDLVLQHQETGQTEIVKRDVTELHERVRTAFESTADLVQSMEAYALSRIQHHVLRQQKARHEIDSLKRELVLLEEHSGIRASNQEMHIVPIRRIRSSALTYAEYLRYAARGEPLIIVHDELRHDKLRDDDAATPTPGLPSWTKERMIAACQNKTFTLKKKALVNATQHWARLERVGTMTIEQFYNAIQQQPQSQSQPQSNMSNGYLHDQNLALHCPQLLEDVVVPSWFSNDLMQRTSPNTTNSYWHSYRDYWPSLFIGPGATTMSYLHADWCDTSAWMGLMSGRKHWRIVPPDDRPLLYESSKKINTFPTDIFAPDFIQHPAMRHITVYDGMLAANEIIFIPAASAHQVENMPGPPTVAIAMNYVDIANVDRFMKRVSDLSQASGESGNRALTDILQMFQQMDLTKERETLRKALLGETVIAPPSLSVPEFKRDFRYQKRL